MRALIPQTIVAAVVAITLLVGWIGSVENLDPLATAVIENRVKAPHPNISPIHFKEFTTQWDRYIEDHFAFRPLLLRGYALFRHYVIHADSAKNIFLDQLDTE